MNRYFGKIDGSKKFIYWGLDKNTNDVVIKFSAPLNNSTCCINVHGNLFVVLDVIKENHFKVLFLSESPEGMKDYFNFDEFTALDAYYWAKYIGDRDIMIDKITSSEDAYYWALNIGNRDIMIDRITDSEYAYWWVYYIGDKEIMKPRITEEKWMKEFEKLK